MFLCLESSSHQMKDGSTGPPQLETVTAASTRSCAARFRTRRRAKRGEFLGGETETANAAARWTRSQVKSWREPGRVDRRRPRSGQETKALLQPARYKTRSGATVAELIMVDMWGRGVLWPPSLPHTQWEEEADRKGEVAETGRCLQREEGDGWEVKPQMSSTHF